ncbi:hypothetical protein [Flavobacterium soli]|uniref:hypothetical protein n=1 Tax=Flavobacterium soli TaxID=344881 RepID=UPI00041D6A59|nr:hypothetical protein [Flavobacterium soli]
MNALQKINIIGLSIPLIVYLIGFIIREDLLILALLSTMITGLIQLVIGLKLLENYSKHPLLQLYFVVVVLFFILWFTTYWDFLWVLPVALAIYMTYILHLINPKN